MAAFPRTLAQDLLEGGVPPSLLIDLMDPEGMRRALAGETSLTAADLAVAAALDRLRPTA